MKIKFSSDLILLWLGVVLALAPWQCCDAKKNIVILSDGTGMEIAGHDKYSNVLRLFRMLEQDKDQIAW